MEGILKDVGCEDVDWTHLPQILIQWWGFMKTVKSLRVPERRIFGLVSSANMSFSRVTGYRVIGS
jgi:hypothetical protein